MKARILLLVAAVLGTILIAVPEAQACSCMASDPRDDLHASDGAFIGTYVGREPTDVTDPYADWDYIFETDKVFKGDIGDTIEVRAAADGAMCGLEYPEGATAALFVYLEEDVWHSDLCRTVDPEMLEVAATPFPAPDAEGPPRLLVGGSFGEVRVIALDKRGRTAGYGYGEGDALYMSMCPGGRRSVEMVGGYRNEQRRSVEVRRISDLKVVSKTSTPRSWSDNYVFPLGAVCTSGDGSAVVFARGFANDSQYTDLTRFEDGRSKRILRGTASEAALGRRRAFLASRKKIIVVDLQTGDKRLLRRYPWRVSHLGLSPDGTRLSFVMGASSSNEAEFVVARSRTGKVTARRGLEGESAYSRLAWVGDDKLLLRGSSRSALLYDRSLRLVASVDEWFPEAAVVDGCTLYGVGYGAVSKTSACDGGPTSLLREFFSPVTFALLSLPPETIIDAPPAP